LAAVTLFIAATPAHAVNTVISSTFDGSEAQAGLPGQCEDAGPLPYRQVAPLTVDTSGQYVLFDAYHYVGLDAVILLYQGAFNPASPDAGLLTPGGIDVAGDVALEAGTRYVLVVQPRCERAEGTFAVTFAGPGAVASASVAAVPAFTQGSFSPGDPVTTSACGASQYQETGPLQVSRDGRYYFQDVSVNFDVDLCLQIYSAPFDAADPEANLVARLDDDGVVELDAGSDYYFVVQPLDLEASGEFFYLFAPPAPFRLNPGLAGSWFNPATAGQGFFLDVFDDINLVFMSWFTYDLDRPDAAVMAQLGDPGHRWLTAFGAFEGAFAPLDIEVTEGGVFDAGEPQPSQSLDGFIDLQFDDCLTGTVTYDLGGLAVSGVVPIQRIAADTVPLCRELTDFPGVPGPL
ncbi:MAG: hypothetical protein R3212_14220, partial [Xanthomonadales bacterium]|nr:hypothetical protein [Xanthomonadales bacterium]